MEEPAESPRHAARLAKDIQQEANGFTFVHAFGAHSQYKIHASKEVQLRDNRILLHEVRIELYGEDGKRMDQIDGDEFEYDQKSGLAIAAGPVEMVLTQPAAPSKRVTLADETDPRKDQRSDLRPRYRPGDDGAARGFLDDAGIGQRHRAQCTTRRMAT